MRKQPTPQAQAAKMIRKELKAEFPDVKFSVRSRSASMMNAVDIDWTDGPTRHDVESIVGKYQYGHFDGMIDCYEYSNRRDDIPQVKFVQCHRQISDETRRQALERIADKFGIDPDAPESEWMDRVGTWPSQAVHQELTHQTL